MRSGRRHDESTKKLEGLALKYGKSKILLLEAEDIEDGISRRSDNVKMEIDDEEGVVAILALLEERWEKRRLRENEEKKKREEIEDSIFESEFDKTMRLAKEKVTKVQHDLLQIKVKAKAQGTKPNTKQKHEILCLP